MQQAYFSVTQTQDPRNAYRWLHHFFQQLSRYRSLTQIVIHHNTDDAPLPLYSSTRKSLIASTFNALLVQLGTPLCARFQTQLQQAFL